jgi:CheY-like chemotaxis protein
LHIVPDGEAALAFLRQEGFYAGMPRPQLLLLDIGIPKIDGWEVLETIRATPALAHMPVLMLTGVLMATDEAGRVSAVGCGDRTAADRDSGKG